MLVALPYESASYERREPEQTVLHRVFLEHLETFPARIGTDILELPSYVERELRAFVECGVLANGFVRIRCGDCGKSRAVAFSCKGRGFCPSCTGRRMADTSARLVDDVLFPPEVPVRQWVLSLPIQIRYRLAHDAKLLSSVLRVFLRVAQGWYRKQGRAFGITECRGGSVTFAQRFGSALNLNPHFHSLVVDGVFNGKNAKFHEAPPLRDEDVKEIVETTAHRVIRLLERQGVLDGDGYDEFSEEQPLLSGITAASVFNMVATGERTGFRVRRVLSDPAEGVRTGKLCYASRGFSLRSRMKKSCGRPEATARIEYSGLLFSHALSI